MFKGNGKTHMKIAIKNTYWQKEPLEQVKGLLDIIFYGNIFFMANIVYFLFTWNVIMMIINALICTLFLLIQVSYNKRER
jgi:hypothetical protein